MADSSFKPSSLQRSMQEFFASLLKQKGIESNFEMQGLRELVHKYTLPSIHAEVWVYSDGANILTESDDLRLELCDFDSLRDLENDLKENVLKLMS